MQLWRVALTPVVTVVALASVTASQGPSYRDLIAAYRHDPDTTVVRLLAVPGADLAPAVDALLQASDTTVPTADLNAAALMHTDAMAALMKQERAADASQHLAFAGRLIDRAALDPEDTWFAYQWYRAVIDMLEGNSAMGPAVSARLNKLPNVRSATWFDDALEAEVRGCTRPNADRGTPGTSAAGADSPVYLVPALFTAATAYDNVLKANPHLVLAAVHLGRIRMLRGNDGDARKLFGQALRASDSLPVYLAHLFLGALDERAERFEDAESHYRAAMGLYPRASSSRLALAALLMRRGRGAETDGLVEPAITLPRDGQRFDPWWSYLARHRASEPWDTIDRLRGALLR